MSAHKTSYACIVTHIKTLYVCLIHMEACLMGFDHLLAAELRATALCLQARCMLFGHFSVQTHGASIFDPSPTGNKSLVTVENTIHVAATAFILSD